METQDNFEMNLEDPRFSNVLDNHQFHIDPTNPHFKKTKSMNQLLIKKRDKNDVIINTIQEPSRNEKVELSNLVSSVKRKSELAKGQGKRQKL